MQIDAIFILNLVPWDNLFFLLLMRELRAHHHTFGNWLLIIFISTWQWFQHSAICRLLLPHFSQAVLNSLRSPQEIKDPQVVDHTFWCKNLQKILATWNLNGQRARKLQVFARITGLSCEHRLLSIIGQQWVQRDI